jgi:hypothetical protein
LPGHGLFYFHLGLRPKRAIFDAMRQTTVFLLIGMVALAGIGQTLSTAMGIVQQQLDAMPPGMGTGIPGGLIPGIR